MASWGKILKMPGMLADLVFGVSCPGCDQPMSSGQGQWCRFCAEALLKATTADYCPRCGMSVGPYLLDPAGCKNCRRTRNPLDGFARVGHYDSLVGEIVKKYKFGRRQSFDLLLGSMLADVIGAQPWSQDIDALVPVPATLHSRLSYRFRPVHLLTATAGEKLSLPVLPMVNVRGKKRRQTELSPSQRAENVRGVFHVSRHAHITGATLCVIDDVSTTGATVREVAQALKKAGAARVFAATVAKA